MTSLSSSARSAATSRTARQPAHVFGLMIALALQTMLAAPAAAQAGDPVVARVNGADVRQSDLAIAEEDIGANLPAGEQGKRDYLTTFLADMILVAKAAEARKMADGEDFKRRLAYYRNKILMEMLLLQEGRSSVSDAALHRLYNEAVQQTAGEKEVHARHILVESENDAKAILAELKKGSDFGSLASKHSKDTGASEGGDLGYFTRDQMVPEFAEVAFALTVGQLSDPVKTQFGWHIIKVEDRRDRQIPEFDQVKDQLEAYLTRQAQADLISKLRAEGKVEHLDLKHQGRSGATGEPNEN
jgi:peptidyl-prolyl cis-trans isomerase C